MADLELEDVSASFWFTVKTLKLFVTYSFRYSTTIIFGILESAQACLSGVKQLATKGEKILLNYLQNGEKNYQLATKRLTEIYRQPRTDTCEPIPPKHPKVKVQ